MNSVFWNSHSPDSGRRSFTIASWCCLYGIVDIHWNIFRRSDSGFIVRFSRTRERIFHSLLKESWRSDNWVANRLMGFCKSDRMLSNLRRFSAQVLVDQAAASYSCPEGSYLPMLNNSTLFWTYCIPSFMRWRSTKVYVSLLSAVCHGKAKSTFSVHEVRASSNISLLFRYLADIHICSLCDTHCHTLLAIRSVRPVRRRREHVNALAVFRW